MLDKKQPRLTMILHQNEQETELEIPEAPTCTEIAQAVHALSLRNGRWQSANSRPRCLRIAVQDLQSASRLYPTNPAVARFLAHAITELMDFSQASGIDLEGEILCLHQATLKNQASGKANRTRA